MNKDDILYKAGLRCNAAIDRARRVKSTEADAARFAAACVARADRHGIPHDVAAKALLAGVHQMFAAAK